MLNNKNMKIVPKIKEYNRKLIGEEYHQLINEELGISNEVEEVANIIFNLIKNNRNITSIRNIGFIGSAKLNIDMFSFDDEYKVYTFNDECGYIRRVKNPIKNNKIYNIEFDIQYASLNGKIIDTKLLDAVYHEVEHAYQDYRQLLNGVDELDNINNYRNTLYNFAVENMYSQNKYMRIFCFITYMSYRLEQDAYANQLYPALKEKQNVINKYNLNAHYQATESFKFLQKIQKQKKEIETNWNSNNPLYIDMLRELEVNNIKFNKEQFINIVDNIMKRYSNKLGKVLTKFMKDAKINEHIIYYKKCWTNGVSGLID
jgi:hypothetical protein